MPSVPYQPQVRITATPEPGQVQVPHLLTELSVEQWALWRRHPVSDLLLARYLPDWRGALERQALDGWIGGKLTLQAEQEARGYLLGAHMIENLALDQVRTFYGLETLRDQEERKKLLQRPSRAQGY